MFDPSNEPVEPTPKPGFRLRKIGPPDAQIIIEVPLDDALTRAQLTDAVSFLLDDAGSADLDAELNASINDHPELFDQPDPRDEEIAALRARVAELEQAEAPLLPAPDALMSEYGAVGDAEAEAALTTDDLLAADDETQTDVIGKLSRQRRKRFTELLNVELAELQQSRGGPKEDRKREAKIERLLGVFARVGEM